MLEAFADELCRFDYRAIEKAFAAATDTKQDFFPTLPRVKAFAMIEQKAQRLGIDRQIEPPKPHECQSDDERKRGLGMVLQAIEKIGKDKTI